MLVDEIPHRETMVQSPTRIRRHVSFQSVAPHFLLPSSRACRPPVSEAPITGILALRRLGLTRQTDYRNLCLGNHATFQDQRLLASRALPTLESSFESLFESLLIYFLELELWIWILE